ncbi:SusC/RagA family TonB-linked outer membrane protein [Epilithonimonas sp.]|uniref:SusC/RagA family TonB-linked outer membrane protein n=1 Tax=Epilithonimonas sp. TaxID=2894511 RepID=UPI00289F7147|nr:SusC/RagA family TonB-linked outer membrane protein [Epilithonimonas sp.]
MKNSYYTIGGIFFGLMLITVSTNLKAQTRNISGTVTTSGKPISGVIISQEGSQQVTTTSANGTYTLQVTAENPILWFRHPDYSDQKVTLTNQTVVNISLEQHVKGIEEVILNAGYYKVKDKESTGSIAKFSAKDIENQPVNNVLSSLQGRMAGVNIIQNTGTPGGGFEVQIRGKNSLRTYKTTGVNGNNPLYVIDGVPVPALNEFKSGLSSGVIPYGDTNPLNAINPNDIESIEVLKDADATAIYGSRGANGVVLISTKRGIKGKTAVQFNTSYGIGQYANLPKMMSTADYLTMRRLAFANDGITQYPASEYDVNGTWDVNKQTDWQKYFVGNRAEYSNTQMGVSGGNENTSFSISGSHNEETTVYPGDYRYKRNSFNAHLEHTSSDKKFKALLTAYYTKQDNVLPPRDFNQIYSSLAPNAPDLYRNGVLNWENSTFRNPMGEAQKTYTGSNENLNANLILDYKLGAGFSVKLNSGYTDNKGAEQQIFPKTIYDPAYNIGSNRSMLRKASMNNTSWILEPQLNYEVKKDNHQWSVLLGGSFQEQKSDNLSLMGMNFPSDELIYNMASAALVMAENAYNFTYRYQAIYTRLNYGFKDRYFINLSGRRDGSSRFGPDRRFANFGAVGVAWLFSRESFLENSNWLSLGKIRGSYGITGNDQIGDYQYMDTYTTTGETYNGTTVLNPTRLYNKDFGWEVTKKLEAALELSLFKDRLFFSAAYYRNISDNQLLGIKLPATTGFPSVLGNMDATVLNTGLELVLQSKLIQQGDWSWSASFNITFPKDKLLDFPNLESSTYKNFFEIGRSTSLRKLYQYNGIDQATGLYTFEDFNNDGVINSADRMITKELRQYWYGGLQNTLRYKNWSLNVLLQISRQNQSNLYASDGYLGLMENKSVIFLDYWTPDNPNARFQKPSAGYDAAAINANSQFLESDATVSNTYMMRLKNASLNYAIPNNQQKRLNATVYVQGQNLFTWSNYKGINPEFTLAGFVSPLRIVSFGINLTY